MKTKYVKQPESGKTKGDGRPGRYADPNKWKTGPDLLTREKYYAFLKHRAQCKFRNEPYALTWEDWLSLWPDSKFLNRGKGRDNFLLQRVVITDPWTISNVEVVTRSTHLLRAKEYRNYDKNI